MVTQVANPALMARRHARQWQFTISTGRPVNSNATAPQRQLPPVAPDADGDRSGRWVTEVSKPNEAGYSSNCGRSSTISCHGAFERTKKCDFGRPSGSVRHSPMRWQPVCPQSSAARRSRNEGRRSAYRSARTDSSAPGIRRAASGNPPVPHHHRWRRRRRGPSGTSSSGTGPHARWGHQRRRRCHRKGSFPSTWALPGCAGRHARERAPGRPVTPSKGSAVRVPPARPCARRRRGSPCRCRPSPCSQRPSGSTAARRQGNRAPAWAASPGRGSCR